jgi:hypothetical protein
MTRLIGLFWLTVAILAVASGADLDAMEQR